MRKPKRSDSTDDNGEVDYDEYESAMGDYEDAERDREIEERWEREEEDVGDQIHEQRRDEKNERE